MFKLLSYISSLLLAFSIGCNQMDVSQDNIPEREFGPIENTNSQLSNVSRSSGPYCESYSDFCNEEWISQVVIGEFTNPSGAQNYSDFTNIYVKMTVGDNSITITPSYSEYDYPEYFNVWIDLNGNGDFNESGEGFYIGRDNKAISGTITIPESAIPQPGTELTTRMRISMIYYAQEMSSCSTFRYGEVEDYTVIISSVSDSDNDGSTSDVDCDDNDKNTYPGAPESGCDNKDNDCDGEIDEEVVIVFSDDYFKNNVIAEVGLTTDEVLNTDVCGITNFDFRRKGISDISGIQYMTNLTRFSLQFNLIRDISPLSGLTKLTNINLWHNYISDISPLSDLTNLTRINVQSNKISDLSPLASLTKLNTLHCSINNISNVSPLSGLNYLAWLYLDLNQISDLSPLSGMINLREIQASHNKLTDISSLSGLINLRYLTLESNMISSVSPLLNLNMLLALHLKDNPLGVDDCQDIGVLEANIQYLYHDAPCQ